MSIKQVISSGPGGGHGRSRTYWHQGRNGESTNLADENEGGLTGNHGIFPSWAPVLFQ